MDDDTEFQINGYDVFNPINGELGSDVYHIVKSCRINSTDWYPFYDWLGRYTGSVLGGKYIDKSNMIDALIDMGWSEDAVRRETKWNE